MMCCHKQIQQEAGDTTHVNLADFTVIKSGFALIRYCFVHSSEGGYASRYDPE